MSTFYCLSFGLHYSQLMGSSLKPPRKYKIPFCIIIIQKLSFIIGINPESIRNFFNNSYQCPPKVAYE